MKLTAGPLYEALREIDQLRKNLAKQQARQITATGDCELIRAYSLAWTSNHRASIQSLLGSSALIRVDEYYQRLHTCTYRATSKSAYLLLLNSLRTELLDLQEKAIARSAEAPTVATPSFSPLVPNREMAALLDRRVAEIANMIDKAPLASSIMMGALLEALFLARINAVTDKRRLFSLKATPKDKLGKPKELKEWGLNDFIEVSHEMKWVTKPLKDISKILRDYRNVIHPVKELSLMIELKTEILVTVADAKMFWRVFCELSEQITASM